MTRKLARKHGYVPLQIQQITAEVGISHQAFYGHFANKRDVVCKATSEELGAIVELAMKGARQPEPWAERLLADIDAALTEAYPAKDGPEQWLRRCLTKAICSEGYEALRIKELIEASRLGHGEFYRRYGGKKGCLRHIYGSVLTELREEVGRSEQQPLVALADRLASDERRSKLLVVGAAHLPPGPGTEPVLATQQSLPDFVGELVSTSFGPHTPPEPARLIAGGAIEVIRSAVLGDRLDQLKVALAALAGELPGTTADRRSVGLLAA